MANRSVRRSGVLMHTSSPVQSDYRRLILALLTLTLLSAPVFAEPARKFYPDDPIAVEPETQDASRVIPWKIGLFYDLLLNQFAHPGDPARPRAKNVNTIEEVPDSSWFTNRL